MTGSLEDWEAEMQAMIEADPDKCNNCWRNSISCECEE